MTSRTLTTTVAGRTSSMRRLRRRSATTRLFCRTNGCASFLELDSSTGVASCEICGYRLQTH